MQLRFGWYLSDSVRNSLCLGLLCAVRVWGVLFGHLKACARVFGWKDIPCGSVKRVSLYLFLFPGGFNKFQTEYSEHCETNLDSSSPNNSPPASVLGLGGLRISSDCSDGESDREPSSATESDGSPIPSNQPAFPVQILPYLYLGCAKDSTNLDILGKYGIKYILNVTPNLPNMFEHDGEFKYKQIPISDHWSQNLSQFFPEAIAFIGR